MEAPGIVEHQGFFIQVVEDRYELVIILHILLVRNGIVNIFLWYIQLPDRKSPDQGYQNQV
jgi:hypothetical protein